MHHSEQKGIPMGAIGSMAKRRRPTQPREKIELRAPADWVAKVEHAAAALGLSVSAYVRLAVSERMERTRREQGEPRYRREDD
jgi:hypothetical protein